MTVRRTLALSDRAVKALQRVDRGKGKPVLVHHSTKELDGLVTRWVREDKEYLTLTRTGRDVVRSMRRPRD